MTKKLYFRYGAMSSSKTAQLLMVRHNYQQQSKKVLLLKPKIDNRFGEDTVNSRSGLKADADILIDNDYNLLGNDIDYSLYSCILVDECQFLSIEQIEQLRIITLTTPVICYGLRTDYKTKMFPGSKRLMELADTIEEIKTTCNFCNKKAIINMKYISGTIIKDGNDEIEIGAEEKYLASCWSCWYTNSVII